MSIDLVDPGSNKNVETSDITQLWKNEIDDPRNFDPDNCVFIVSGFRSQEFLENPQKVIDPYYERIHCSLIGKSPDIKPNWRKENYRLDTFRPYGAILQINDPLAVVKIMSYDPGPPGEEVYEEESLSVFETEPRELLDLTHSYNEIHLRLSRHTEYVKLSGLFMRDDQLETDEGKRIINAAESLKLPLLVIHPREGTIRTYKF